LFRIASALLAACLAGAGMADAQTSGRAPSARQAPPPAPADPVSPEPAASVASATRSALVRRVPPEQFATLRFSNRDVITFRATIVPRDPAERAYGAERALDRLVDDAVTGPVAARSVLGAAVVTVAGRDILAILPDDVDEAGGDSLRLLTDRTVAQLSRALREAAEARNPSRIAWAVGRSLVATALLAAAMFLLVRVRRRLQQWMVRFTEAMIARSPVGKDAQLLRASRVVDAVRALARLLILLIGAVALYTWLVFVLQQFPLARPWGEALGGFLRKTLATLGWNALTALPGLFTAGLILVTTRFAVRLSGLFFDAVQQGRIDIPALSGHKAVPTRRLVSTLMWLFGLVVAYPYVPGSNTEAFKGVSVFVGLVVSLGSSGVVNQLMSGFMLTYSDGLAPGDYVRVGEVEGTVAMLGVLSTKIRTPLNEDVTIPNAVMIAGTTVNYSRHQGQGVFARTVVTIGYDTPWRQVEAMLLMAADRTSGIRKMPPPFVLHTNLSDFYVEYTLLTCVDIAELRKPTLAKLNAHIQDAFNEHGVQIMSPHYVMDPATEKVVPRERWYQAPAKGPADGGAGSAT
jgi:small-conductance mechanosensitive channel